MKAGNSLTSGKTVNFLETPFCSGVQFVRCSSLSSSSVTS